MTNLPATRETTETAQVAELREQIALLKRGQFAVSVLIVVFSIGLYFQEEFYRWIASIIFSSEYVFAMTQIFFVTIVCIASSKKKKKQQLKAAE